MQISWLKTTLMAITPNPTNHLPSKICNKEVQFVDSFTYLGSLMTNHGSSYSLDITYRIAKAASLCVAYQINCFANTSSASGPRSTCIAPWLSPSCYDSEAWATTLADRRRLCVQHALPNLRRLPRRCVLVAARQQPKHP